jgi:hypothetical protein
VSYEKQNHLKEVGKLQTIVDQQNRYINDSKAKSNNNIRILHSQLTASNSEITKLSNVLNQLRTGEIRVDEI